MLNTKPRPIVAPVGFLRMKSRKDLSNDEARARGLQTQSAWYDHTYSIFEVVGPMDINRIHTGLNERVWSPSCGKFGGGTSIGSVTAEDANHVLVEFIYSIGD